MDPQIRHADEKELYAHDSPREVPATPTWDPKVYRRAELLADLVVTSTCTMLYLLSFLDRANIGNARVAGFQKALGITDREYSTALTTTYVPYILSELPANLLIKRVGPNIMLPAFCLMWGVVSMCQGFVRSYSGLLAARFFLGLTEGGLLPGIVLFLSSFYPRHRLQLRIAILFCATSSAGAFSGLLAAAIAKMDGVGNYPGWAWIFILEGLFTILFAIAAFFLIPRKPSTAWFYNAEQKATIEAVMVADCAGEATPDPFSWTEVKSALFAPQIWIMLISFFCDGTTLFGLAVFVPTIVGAFGNGPTQTQLLSVPPYVCAAVLSIAAAFFSDRYGRRGLTAIFFSAIAVVGYAMYLGSTNTNTLYGALFLQVIGAYGTAPTISAWHTNNISPHYRRATGIAMAFTFTNCGGILSTWLFTNGPRFTVATSVQLAFSALVIFASLANMAYLASQNKKKAAILAQYPGGVDPNAGRRVPYDTEPSYRYTL